MIRTQTQETFCGTDNGAFRWVTTADGKIWYEHDYEAGNKAALKARNARARELVKAGRRIRKFSSGSQLRRFGGIGSGKPDIEVYSKGYGIDILD